MIETLREITDELLSNQTVDNGLNAVTRLYSLCAAITGINENSGDNDSNLITLPHGEAISPKDAAGCLLDYHRTSKFLQGLHAAIIEAQKRFPGKTVEILYAGCGPFAPLALPLTTRFSSGAVKFTLLDVHECSLDAARLIFQVTGNGEFVRDYVLCDAATYQHATSQPIHIVIVEAMQAALEREPQAAMTINLAPQLCLGGIFIPERINIDCHLRDVNQPFVSLAAANDDADFSAHTSIQIKLGRVLDLTAERYRRSLGFARKRDETLLAPKVTLAVPDHLTGEFYLTLATAVNVFESIRLKDNESGLTCPKILFDAGKLGAGNLIEFAYYLGIKSGFIYSVNEKEKRER